MNVLYNFEKDKITINNTEIAVKKLLLENYSFIFISKATRKFIFLMSCLTISRLLE